MFSSNKHLGYFQLTFMIKHNIFIDLAHGAKELGVHISSQVYLNRLEKLFFLSKLHVKSILFN